MATLPKVSFTLSSDAAAAESMIRFGLRCALFFAPLVAVLAFSAASLHTAGELISPDRVFELQESTGAFYEPMYQPKSVYPSYKLLVTLKRHPDVLVLGTSRVFSMRSEFIREPKNRFYNAYIFAAPLGAVRQFLEQIPPNQLPRFLFVDIDPWGFRADAEVGPEAEYFRPSSRMQILDFAWRNGIYCGTQRWMYSAPPNFVGASARMNRAGLRPDGSSYANVRFLDTVPGLLESQLKTVREGADFRFQRGSKSLSADALEEVQRLLSYCSAHHVTVIGYISTYHPALYDALRSDSRMDYLWRVAPALAPRFEEIGALLFDFQNPASVGCQADEYLDAFHESEVCTAKVFLAMANRDARTAAVLDAGKLEELLHHRRSAWQFSF
jgi:hypothetical protein